MRPSVVRLANARCGHRNWIPLWVQASSHRTQQRGPKWSRNRPNRRCQPAPGRVSCRNQHGAARYRCPIRIAHCPDSARRSSARSPIATALPPQRTADAPRPRADGPSEAVGLIRCHDPCTAEPAPGPRDACGEHFQTPLQRLLREPLLISRRACTLPDVRHRHSATPPLRYVAHSAPAHPARVCCAAFQVRGARARHSLRVPLAGEWALRIVRCGGSLCRRCSNLGAPAAWRG